MAEHIFEIDDAKLEGARLVIGIAGQSGDGKTRTAIELAYGMSNWQPSKIGLLDAENRRGSLYARVLENNPYRPTKERFKIGNLIAPFTPDRYRAAIMAFQDAGVEILIIDSTSHEYEGEGGYLDIRKPIGNSKIARDNVASEEHKKFMRALLQSDMHVICCIRAREKTAVEKDGQGKTVYVPLGLLPIQHRDFMFEMTTSIMMHDQGTRQTVIKMHDDLAPMLARGEGYITSLDGERIRAWVDGAEIQLDPTVEKYKNRLQSRTGEGRAAIDGYWAQVPPAMQTALGAGFLASLRASADAFDQAAADRVDVDGDQLAVMNAATAAAAARPVAARAVVAAPATLPVTPPADDGEPFPPGETSAVPPPGADFNVGDPLPADDDGRVF